jgi:type II secretion system (T2SS) protein M
MQGRDRMLLIGGVVIALLVVTWMFWVSPERKKAADLAAQVTQAQQSLTTAQSQLAAAQASKAKYASAYVSLVNVGKAVPATPEVPSLIYELDQASHVRDVAFNSITTGSGSGGGSSSSSSAAAAAAPTSFTALPFTFQFTGTFFDLYHLLGRLNAFAVQTKDGTLKVTGRLLTIQGASLTPSQSAASPGTSAPVAGGLLTGTVTADAYVLPPTSASSSTSGSGSSGAAPAGGSSTTGTPAVIQPGS